MPLPRIRVRRIERGGIRFCLVGSAWDTMLQLGRQERLLEQAF